MSAREETRGSRPRWVVLAVLEEANTSSGRGCGFEAHTSHHVHINELKHNHKIKQNGSSDQGRPVSFGFLVTEGEHFLGRPKEPLRPGQ